MFLNANIIVCLICFNMFLKPVLAEKTNGIRNSWVAMGSLFRFLSKYVL